MLNGLSLIGVTGFIPIVLSIVINNQTICNTKEEKKIKYGFNIVYTLINIISLCLVTKVFCDKSTYFHFVISCIKKEVSYQDISRIIIVIIVCTVLSLVYPYVMFLINKTYKWLEYDYIHEKRTTLYTMLILAFEVAALMIICNMSFTGAKKIEISEYCRKYVLSEEEIISYVTIKNTGKLRQNLTGIAIELEDNDSNSVVFENVQISPLGEIKLKFDYDEGLQIKKKGGETVVLLDSQRNILSSVELPKLDDNEAYISVGDSWEIVPLELPLTEIEEVNSTEILAPIFSHESGFYESEFDLELKTNDGNKIYYTLDGSNPTNESLEYKEPIFVYNRSDEENVYRNIRNVRRDYLNHSYTTTKVNKIMVVKAVCCDENNNYSDVVTKSYFVDMDRYSQGVVISLTSDPEGLFGDNGICVTGPEYDEWYEDVLENTPEGEKIDTSGRPIENYMQKGDEWIREATIQLFVDGEECLNHNIDISVQGNGARYALKQKRFSLVAKKKYTGENVFAYQLFGDYDTHSMFLRPGDEYAICQKLGEGRDLLTINNVVATVFLDGEFWYKTYLYEKFNSKNVALKYGLTPENVVMVKNGETTLSAFQGSNSFNDIESFINQNNPQDASYYEKFDAIVDLQSYMDSICYNSFLANLDYQEYWNNLLWHTIVEEDNEIADTRWRWGLYDMDLGWSGLREEYGEIKPYEINPFTMYGKYQSSPVTEYKMFKALRQNDTFCKKFVITYTDLLNSNFSVENTMCVLENLKQMKDEYVSFFENRPDYMVDFLREEFGLGRYESVLIYNRTPNKGEITLNTFIPNLKKKDIADEEYSWEGKYFTDYPITISVDEHDGYTFDYWEIVSNGKTDRYTDRTLELSVEEGGVEIHAIFK